MEADAACVNLGWWVDSLPFPWCAYCFASP